MARKHGKTGSVSMDLPPTTSPGTYAVVADLNSWTLDMTKDRVDVTAFGDTNKQKVVGLPDFSGTIGGWWNSLTTPALFDAVLGNDPAYIRLTPSTDEPTFYAEGLAYLDGSISVAANGAVSISSKFDAAGNWVWMP